MRLVVQSGDWAFTFASADCFLSSQSSPLRFISIFIVRGRTCSAPDRVDQVNIGMLSLIIGVCLKTERYRVCSTLSLEVASLVVYNCLPSRFFFGLPGGD